MVRTFSPRRKWSINPLAAVRTHRFPSLAEAVTRIVFGVAHEATSRPPQLLGLGLRATSPFRIFSPHIWDGIRSRRPIVGFVRDYCYPGKPPYFAAVSALRSHWFVSLWYSVRCGRCADSLRRNTWCSQLQAPGLQQAESQWIFISNRHTFPLIDLSFTRSVPGQIRRAANPPHDRGQSTE